MDHTTSLAGQVKENEMERRILAFDWSQTPLGSIETWPQSLKTAVRIMLTSRQPMWLGWGKQLIKLYNDPYKAIVGGKHPTALGQPAAVVWREIWNEIEPMLETAMGGIEGTYVEEQLLIMERNGYLEETYYTFSYSPIPDDESKVGGIICANTDDTLRVIGERQMALLGELAARTADARTVEQACALSTDCLAMNPQDLPFAMIYLVEPEARQVVLTGNPCGIQRGHIAAPEAAPLDKASVWPFAEVLATNRECVISELGELANSLPTGAWDRAPQQVVAMPIAAQGRTGEVGILVVGLNPYQLFDHRYRGFLELVAAQIAASIANAQAYEAERKRAEALAEIDRLKTAFFSNVSHEFRTPLTLMLGPLEDILAENELPPLTHERMSMAHRNAQRLLRLVNTLLDFSRLEAGRLEAIYEVVDLAALTTDLTSLFRSAIERAGMQLIVECSPLPEAAWVDREMWEKIVLNLLSNAFKFTFEGTIKVTLRQTGKVIELAVSDTGTGIPAEELPHLFERFYRVKGAQGRSYEGSGIGLSLVQELIRLHGGTVSIHSEVNRGSTFTVSLPTGSAHLPAAQIGATRRLVSTSLQREAYVEEVLRWLPSEKDERGEMKDESEKGDMIHPSSFFPHPSTHPSSLILLADDNTDMRDYVRRLLVGIGYEVIAVGDGEAALEAARKQSFDLVLTDVMMPRLDGFGLLKALRDDEKTRGVPVILLSARAGEEARIEGMEAGADDYLTKPFSARELLARVEAHLKLQRLRRESEIALRESEERFRNMADHAPVMIWVTEADGSCSYLSQSWYEFTGQTPETGRGFGWLEATHPDDKNRATEEFMVANEKGAAFQLEYRLRRGDGEYRWAIDSAHPRFSATGEFLGYIGSVIDITDRKRIELEREQVLVREQQARALAEDANRAKDEWLALVSHELRTPLNAILGHARLLELRRARLHPELADFVDLVRRNGERQNEIINDLLDTARMMTGKLWLELAPFNLAPVIHDALAAVRPSAQVRNLTLLADLEAGAGTITGDATRLHQAVLNLLTNAIKFTPVGGVVAIILRREQEHLTLTVKDTGQGIAPDFLPHIFERFSQADSSRSRRHGGLGLGLALVKQIVELHGGTIMATSPGVGQGATFTVTLPLQAVSTLSQVTPPPERHAAEEIFQLTETPRLDGVRLLVVDDQEDARSLVEKGLCVWGAEIQTVSSGQEALALLDDQKFDVLICDIAMPDEDGYEVMRRLRALEDQRGALFTQRLPAIALTAMGSSGDRMRALSAGFQMHVTKPVELVELAMVIRSLLVTRQEPALTR